MPQKIGTILAVALLTFIAGCASDPSWRKAGVSREDATTALSECKYQVGLSKVSQDQQREIIANCMQGKGYRWRTE